MSGWWKALRGLALGVVVWVAGCEPEADTAWDGFAETTAFRAERGVTPDACHADAECGPGAVCPVAYGYCVRPCRSDAECLAPSRCLHDRLELDFCGCEGERCSEPLGRL